MKAPPKEAIKLFEHIDVKEGYVGVIRPIPEKDSNIELPEGVERESNMGDFPTRVARVGDNVDNVESGDKALVSLMMQQPHQIVERSVEYDNGEEDVYHMFIIDDTMIVATIHDQREAVDGIFN